jgi:hypothetical protein
VEEEEEEEEEEEKVAETVEEWFPRWERVVINVTFLHFYHGK